MKKPVPLKDRLYAKVKRNEATGCLEWQGSTNASGYGQIGIGRHGAGCMAVSRAAWVVNNGEIPPSLCVCHKCDNRLCLEIKHLFLGTNAQNSADMVTKGRSAKPKGSKHPHAKLSEEDVKSLRLRYMNENISQKELAKQYGIAQATLSDIITRKKWGHVP